MPKSIEAVLEEHSLRLMAVDGVVAVAQGLNDGTPCIRVLVIKRTSELLRKIPLDIEGYAVIVDESGRINALGGD